MRFCVYEREREPKCVTSQQKRLRTKYSPFSYYYISRRTRHSAQSVFNIYRPVLVQGHFCSVISVALFYKFYCILHNFYFHPQRTLRIVLELKRKTSPMIRRRKRKRRHLCHLSIIQSSRHGIGGGSQVS